MTCHVCGRAPVATITVRPVVGMFFLARVSTFRGVLCREHGVRVVRASLMNTLGKGWWSVSGLSFLDPVVIVLDLLGLWKEKRVAEPRINIASRLEASTERIA